MSSRVHKIKQRKKEMATLSVSDKTRQRLFALYQQTDGAKAVLDATTKAAQSVADTFNQAYAMALEQFDLVPGENVKIDLSTGVISVDTTPDNVTPITDAKG